MDFSKINELKPYDLNCNIFDVYSYNGLSMQELLCQFFNKINECVKTSNETIDLAEWLVNEGLKQEVAIKLTTWLNDGTLENLINVTLFENLNKKIDNVSSQLEQIEINVKMFGAKGDGVTDDTQSFINALNYCKENNIKKMFVDEGLYLIDSVGEPTNDVNVRYGKILIHSGFTFEMHKKATLLVKPNNSPAYSCLTVVGSDNVKIKGGTIIGDRNTHPGSIGEWGYGISIHHSKNITIEDVEIKDCWGDCIDLRSASKWVTPNEIENENITIKNCLLTGSRRQGISIESGINVLIDNCIIKNITGTAPESGIDIESNGVETVQNIKITNCTFEHNTNGVYLRRGQDVFISNCYFSDNKETNIKSFHTVSNAEISNCQFKGTSVNISLSNALVSNNIFSNSVLTFVNHNYFKGTYKNININNNMFINGAIQSYLDKGDVVFSNIGVNGNILINEDKNGLYFNNIDNLNISNNVINGGKFGIETRDCLDVSISNNKIYNIQRSGIVTGNCQHSQINDNTINAFATDTADSTNIYGIFLIDSHNSKIANNFINDKHTNYNNVGIKIDSDKCFIVNNYIESDNVDSTGILISKDYNIAIYNDLRYAGNTKIYRNPSMNNNIINNNFEV